MLSRHQCKTSPRRPAPVLVRSRLAMKGLYAVLKLWASIYFNTHTDTSLGLKQINKRMFLFRYFLHHSVYTIVLFSIVWYALKTIQIEYKSVYTHIARSFACQPIIFLCWASARLNAKACFSVSGLKSYKKKEREKKTNRNKNKNLFLSVQQ